MMVRELLSYPDIPIHHQSAMNMNATYVCRVNSTLGSQNLILSSGEPTTVTQFETQNAANQNPNIPVIPITAASAGTLLILLGIIFILVCIISLR